MIVALQRLCVTASDIITTITPGRLKHTSRRDNGVLILQVQREKKNEVAAPTTNTESTSESTSASTSASTFVAEDEGTRWKCVAKNGSHVQDVFIVTKATSMEKLQDCIDNSMMQSKTKSHANSTSYSQTNVTLQPNMNAVRSHMKQDQWMESHQNQHVQNNQKNRLAKKNKNEKVQLRKLKNSKASKEGLDLNAHAERNASIVKGGTKGQRGKGAKINKVKNKKK